MPSPEIVKKREKYLKLIKDQAKITKWLCHQRSASRDWFKKLAKLYDRVILTPPINLMFKFQSYLYRQVPIDELIVYDGTLEDREEMASLYMSLYHKEEEKYNGMSFNYYCLEPGCTKYIKGSFKDHGMGVCFKSECYGHDFAFDDRYWDCCEEHKEY